MSGQHSGTKRVRRGVSGATFALAVALIAACGGDAEPAVDAEALTPELQAVLSQVAELRELPEPPPFETAMVPRDDVREVLESTLTDADREHFDELTTLYRLLGFIGPADQYETLYLDFAAEAGIGFFDPLDERFYLVGDEREIDFATLDAYRQTIVAHEFVHAIQDAEFGFPEATDKAVADLDWSLGLTAVIEGDAVFHERLWARDHLGVNPLPEESEATQGSIPAALERLFRFPYEDGLNWVATVQPRRGNEAINGILRGRRMTTAEILHPQLYEADFQPRALALPDLGEALGGDWKQVSGGSFGEFHLRNFLQLHLTGLPAVQAADGWRGDDYQLYASGDDSVAAVRVGFEGGPQGAEFEAAMIAWFGASGAAVSDDGRQGGFDGGRTVVFRRLSGEEALLVFGSSPEVAAEALEALEVD